MSRTTKKTYTGSKRVDRVVVAVMVRAIGAAATELLAIPKIGRRLMNNSPHMCLN